MKSTYINLLHIFLQQFQRIGVVIYYVVMILHFATFKTTDEDIIVYVLPLTMHFLLQLSKALYLEYIKKKQDLVVNNYKVTRFRKLRRERPT